MIDNRHEISPETQELLGGRFGMIKGGRFELDRAVFRILDSRDKSQPRPEPVLRNYETDAVIRAAFPDGKPLIMPDNYTVTQESASLYAQTASQTSAQIRQGSDL